MNCYPSHFKLLPAIFIGLSLALLIPTDSAWAQQQPDPAAGTTWLIFRHAEREGRADQLSAAGRQRAEVLKQLGTTLRVAAIYSTDFNRTKDTVAPLAKALDLQVETYPVQGFDWLKEIEQKHQGKVIAVVGHSNTTGEMVAALSGAPNQNRSNTTTTIVCLSFEPAASIQPCWNSPTVPVPLTKQEPNSNLNTWHRLVVRSSLMLLVR